MITVIDNFLPDDIFQATHNQIKNCDFTLMTDEIKSKGVEYPGVRTEVLKNILPILDSSLIHYVLEQKLPFTTRPFTYWQYAHLRVEKDNKNDYIHIDFNNHFAWLIYLSETNLNSGTKFYTNDDDEHTLVRFVQNRFVIFNSDIRHVSWNNHGKDLNDGRLTINGFCNYN